MPVGDDDPVRLMFTSGTESRPKGALLSQPVADVAVRLLRHRRRDAAPTTSTLHTLPLYHCAQLDCFLGVDVYLGATSA